MPKTRTMSMELRAIREQVQESPPPPPAGATVREWFAGLALMNPALMEGLGPHARAVEAVRLADELIKALAAPRVPSQESMAAPTEVEMEQWDAHVASERETKERRERATNPDIKPAKRTRTAAYQFGERVSIPPPPACPTAKEHFKRASDHLLQRPQTPLGAFKVPGMGTYSSLHPQNEDE